MRGSCLCRQLWRPMLGASSRMKWTSLPPVFPSELHHSLNLIASAMAQFCYEFCFQLILFTATNFQRFFNQTPAHGFTVFKKLKQATL